jgi:nucleotide-binding universal stress UspA family protein
MVVAFPVEEYEKGAAANAARILSGVRGAAKKAGVSCDTLHVKDRFPAEGIIDAAMSRPPTAAAALTRLLLGSQANRVVADSTIPALICRSPQLG